MRTQTNGQQSGAAGLGDQERAQRSALAAVRRVERAFADYPWRDRGVYLRARKRARARAMEVIAGNGYPYAIEAADAVAVISQENRAEFYALFQDFAKEAGVPLNFSRKALSKSRRRV